MMHSHTAIHRAAPRAPRRSGRRLLLALSIAFSVAALPAAAAARGVPTTRGPGTMALTPAAVTVSSGGNTMQMRYTAPSSGLSGGVVKILVPSGWSHPQNGNKTHAGYVTVSAGSLRVVHRTITITNLTLCGGCSVTVSYVYPKTPPDNRVSKFVTKSASSASGVLRPLATQPTVTVTTPGAGPGPAWTGPAALGDYAGGNNPLGIARFQSVTGAR